MPELLQALMEAGDLGQHAGEDGDQHQEAGRRQLDPDQGGIGQGGQRQGPAAAKGHLRAGPDPIEGQLLLPQMGDHLGELALVAGLLAMDLDELEGAEELLNLVDQVTVGLAQDLAALFGGIPGLAQQPPEGGPRHQGQAGDGRRQGEGQGQIHREDRQLGKQLQQKDSTHAHPADIRGQNAQEIAAVMLGQETPAGPGQGPEEGIPQVIDEAQLQPLGVPLPQQGHRRLQGDETDEEAQHEQQLALARDAV